MADAGTVELDAPIKRYIPHFSEPVAEVTLYQLLTHMGGIPSLFEYDDNRSYETSELLQKIKELPLDFVPETEARYSNNGYVLLGTAIERLTDNPWQQAVKEYVLDPLPLTSVRYLTEQEGEKLAVGYHETPTGVKPAPRVDPTVLHAAGAMSGSLKDLGLWGDAFHNNKIISKNLLDLAHRRPGLSNGKQGFFGIGLWYVDIMGASVIEHAGGSSGISVDTLYLPDQNTVVVTAANIPNDAQDLARRVAAIIMDSHTLFSSGNHWILNKWLF